MKHGAMKQVLALSLLMILLLSMLPTAFAEETERRVVRVAFPEQAGMSQVDRSGKLSGYNYDYLEKISEFTGWKIEFVAYSDADGNVAVMDAMQDLQDGKVDLMGPMLKNSQTEEMFTYPQTSYGTVYTTLCADVYSALREKDLTTKEIVVGLWEKAATRNATVLNYLDGEHIAYTVKYYDSASAQQEALHNGEVDVISGNSLSPMTNTRIVCRFAAQPYYFATTKGNTELIEQLDAAMQQIDELQPELQERLFNTYFMDTVNAFTLTDAQREVLAQYSELHVLCVDKDAPYTYLEEGEPYGALVLAINDFGKAVGLTPVYTFCESMDEAEELLASGVDYDLLIGLPFTASFCAEKGFVRSEAVFSAGLTLVRTGKRTGDYAEETVAVVQGLEDAFDTSQFQQVVLYDNAAACLDALKRRVVDVAVGDRSVMNYYIYENGNPLSTVSVSGQTHDVTIAVCKQHALPLLGILNNYIASLSTYTRTLYLDKGNVHAQAMTLSRFIASNPVMSVLLITGLTVLIVTAVLLIIHSNAMSHKNQALAKANAAKSDFLSRMSHDIRTPLNGIIGLLHIDESHFSDTALIEKNHQKMMTSANHLLSLVNDVLQMSKLEDGTEKLVEEPVNILDLSKDVVTIVRERAEAGGLSMQITGDRETAYPYVMASPLHLRQIFLNIYGNCIKFTKPGGVIRTEQHCVSTDHRTVTYCWTISDTGIGMSEAFLQHIFEPFAQEHSDARSVYQGTGLGMAIVKELIDQMHGTIKVTSREGVGSTFVITIPFELAAKPEEKPADAAASIQGLRLLLAEDNQLNAEIAQTLFTDKGAQVTLAENGREAVQLFRTRPAGSFDAILMDIMMPELDGLQATKAIRAMERPDAQTIPIIAMTANAFAEDAEKCLAAGMSAFLTKPLDMDKAVKTIAQQCGCIGAK